MKQAALEGHDIQLHIHPEWVSSEFSNGVWHFKENTSSLNDLGFNKKHEDSAPFIVSSAKQYLEDLISPINKDYKCFIFRAGGWLIQPSNKIIELNESLDSTPEEVNSDPYGNGWMVKIEIQNIDELDNLLSADQYKELIGED